jgi:glycine dehydrogenase
MTHPQLKPPMNGTMVVPAGAGGFASRHIGPSAREIDQMIATIGVTSVEELIDQTVPRSIRLQRPLRLGTPLTESEAISHLRSLASKNEVLTSLIGMGYHDTLLPPVIQRNILENPAWYTAYTPYQPEISQGRLEALLNFQTMVCDLTALDIANASLLDEATAAAEAMLLARRASTCDSTTFFVDENVHPQTLAVLRTRAEPLGLSIITGPPDQAANAGLFFGALFQFPGTFGDIPDLRLPIKALHSAGAIVSVAADPLALTLLAPPGEIGADVALGQRSDLAFPWDMVALTQHTLP